MKQLPEFDKARVLVVGDLMLDRYWHGNTSRISPEAPVPVVHVNNAEERPGGAGNVALNIAALGAAPQLLGFTGKDEAAGALEDILQKQGVDCHFQALDDCATVTKLRVLSRHQQLIRLDFEDGFAAQDPSGLLNKLEAELGQAGALILSDYGKGTLAQIPRFIEKARAAGVPVLASVEAILLPMCPDFPMPVTTTRPSQLSISSQAFTKLSLMRDLSALTASISVSITASPSFLIC